MRLRGVMLASARGREPEPGPWQETSSRVLFRGLAAGDVAAFVVAKPDRPGELAACAVGIIERRLGSPRNPAGESGLVVNVSTEEDYRRRGYSRACMVALLAWFEQRGIFVVDLRSTPMGEQLYRSLGFAEPQTLALRRITGHH